MIVGIGNDLVDIRRIENAIKEFGEKFEHRIFTEGERKKAYSREKGGFKLIAATYAKRFAAKEACAKALGARLEKGISWQDIEVVSKEDGAPTLQLHGAALTHLQSITPQGMSAVLHLSLSDEPPYAQAFVIIEMRKVA